MFEPRLQLDILHKKREKLELQLKRFQDVAERRSSVDTCRTNCNQYLQNTTLHGLKYIGDRKISRLER